ncbi:alpha/beta fold hydrolase [Pendulispora rubella]|uniref:Alpha/beta fold hydrolase n=1 Tax=Pendulispora rubella TaxID=2741070 RepID=A0ABZ2KYI5_9BACT
MKGAITAGRSRGWYGYCSNAGCMDDRPNPWIIRRKPIASPRLRLFCFPYAGAGSLVFHLWPDEMDADIEVCAVQLPGRENRLREPPVGDLSRLTRQLVDALAPYSREEFALFGHSFGALVAFELTRELHRCGLRLPRALFVSGRESPSSTNPYPPMGGLEGRAFVDEVVRRYGAIPRAILDEPALLELLIPTLRADLSIIEGYTYRRADPLPVPLCVFGGTEDRAVRRVELEAWRRETRSSFALKMFPGGHFFINEVRSQVLRAMELELGPEPRPK